MKAYLCYVFGHAWKEATAPYASKRHKACLRCGLIREISEDFSA